MRLESHGAAVRLRYVTNMRMYYRKTPNKDQGGPFLESPGNFLGPKSNIQIEI